MAWRYSDETYVLQKMNVLFFLYFLFCLKKNQIHIQIYKWNDKWW